MATSKKNVLASDLSMFSLDYQCAILKMFIEDRDFSLATVDTMDQNHFTANPELRRIAAIIKDKTIKLRRTITYDELDLYVHQTINDDITVETITALVSEKIKSCRFGVSELEAVKSAYQEFLTTMESVRLTKELADLGKGGKINKEDVLEKFSNYDKRTTFSEVHANEADFSDEEFFDYIISDDTYECIPTGCKPLDERLGGGLRKGDVGILVAGSGIGKTCVTSGFAAYAAGKGYNVVHFILEDNPNDVLKKYVGFVTNIAVNQFGANHDKLKEKYHNQNVYEAMMKMRRIRQVASYDKSGRVHQFNTLIIDQELVKLENMGFHPDLVVIDYFDRIKPIYPKQDIWVKDQDISNELNDLAKTHNVAIWVPSQGNKQVQDRATKISMSNMTGGAWKGYTAQIVIAMQKYMEDMSTDNSTIQVLKNRYNNNFTPIGVEFNNGTCRFGKETTNTDAIFENIEVNSKRIADAIFDENKKSGYSKR